MHHYVLLSLYGVMNKEIKEKKNNYWGVSSTIAMLKHYLKKKK